MHRIQLEEFDGERPFVIATGGFASLFGGSGLFDQIVQDLVLRGLLGVLEMNAARLEV
jgi:type III pantothenate kinase